MSRVCSQPSLVPAQPGTQRPCLKKQSVCECEVVPVGEGVQIRRTLLGSQFSTSTLFLAPFHVSANVSHTPD